MSSVKFSTLKWSALSGLALSLALIGGCAEEKATPETPPATGTATPSTTPGAEATPPATTTPPAAESTPPAEAPKTEPAAPPAEKKD
jgi:hypothetical protein